MARYVPSNTHRPRRWSRFTTMAVSLSVGIGLLVGPAASAAATSRSADLAAHRVVRTSDAELRDGALVDAAAAADARARVALVFEAAMRERDAVWDRMARCETNGNWSMKGSAYSGGLGIANSTWAAFGGREFGSTAGYATREQQIVVANRIHDRYGYHAWGCARAIGQ